jgi:hypothetical protein
MAASQETVTHLLSCFDAVYLALGENAPKMTNDSNVVRMHEMSRSFGGVALEMRAHLGPREVAPLAIIGEVVDRAMASDDTGAMTLYAMALVVGPRLLVSLRDAREALQGDGEVRRLLEDAAQVTVAGIRSLADSAPDQRVIDDPQWEEAARRLKIMVETAGNAESFGPSR